MLLDLIHTRARLRLAKAHNAFKFEGKDSCDLQGHIRNFSQRNIGNAASETSGYRDAKIHRTAMPFPLSINRRLLGSALARVEGKSLKREGFKEGPLSR